jgi:rhamnulokinase
VQLMSAGEIASLAEGRDLVRASFPLATYEPRDRAAWDEAHARWLNTL